MQPYCDFWDSAAFAGIPDSPTFYKLKNQLIAFDVINELVIDTIRLEFGADVESDGTIDVDCKSISRHVGDRQNLNLSWRNFSNPWSAARCH